MAATTTLRVPADLEQRIALLAEAAGKTPRAWMIEAIEKHASLAEKRAAFVADALAAAEEVEKTRRVYRLKDVHHYFRARASGKKPQRPKPVKWYTPSPTGGGS